jgi:hypothetical protein
MVGALGAVGGVSALDGWRRELRWRLEPCASFLVGAVSAVFGWSRERRFWLEL